VCVLQWICDWLPKLSCLQRISFRCWKCVFCNEFVIRCWNWVLHNELTFVAENVSCSEFVIRCRNWVGCSELAFTAESVCFATNVWFAAEIVLPAVNKHLLLMLCCLQRINVRCRKCVVCSKFVIRCRNGVVCSESESTTESVLSAANLWFPAKTELSAANQRSLSKLCCLQQMSIRYRNGILCSEAASATESVLSTTNQCSLPNVCVMQRIFYSLSKLSCL